MDPESPAGFRMILRITFGLEESGPQRGKHRMQTLHKILHNIKEYDMIPISKGRYVMSKLFLSLILLFFITIIPSQAAATIEQEVNACKGAWTAAKKHDYQKAVKLSSHRKCPLTTSFVTWKKLRDDKVKSSFTEYLKFIKAHPNWPWMPVVKRKAEESLTEGTSNSDILTLFKDTHPGTARGTLLYLRALRSPEKMASVTRNAWHTLSFSEKDQKQFIALYGKYLSSKDHHIRLENLCYEENTKQAERMLPLLSKEDLPWAKARLSFLKESVKPEKILAKFKNPSHDLIYDCIRWHQQNDQLTGAYLLTRVPYQHTKTDIWWKMRSYYAREALNQDNPKLAYDVMAGHPFEEGENYADAEWFCGWVALRFLNKPELALQHFQNYQKSVSIPPSQAKAEYWLGRTYEFMRKVEQSEQHYQEAATYSATYYGILAKQKTGDNTPLKAKKEMPIPAGTWNKFQNHEFVRIARLLKAAGMEDEAESFLYLLGKRGKSQEEKYMALKVVREVKNHYTIFATKHFGFYEDDIFHWLFPRWQIDTHVNNQGVDHHLLHAIMRQESGFSPRAVSPAGAIGLMQVMPCTACQIAKKNNYKHKESRLKDDPNYNILLGTHFIKELLDRFNGNFILAVAAYNAGPKPVLNWIEKYGDPRDPNVDSVDWIELIPYKETRHYVKAVWANYYIYQALEL